MIDAIGIITSSGIRITWDEIVAVNVYKINAITEVITYLSFDHECGEYIEITNDDHEFQTIIDVLDDYLELPDGWKNHIEGASVEDGIIKLWKKHER